MYMLKCSSDFCCQVGHEGVDVDAGGGVTPDPHQLPRYKLIQEYKKMELQY